ncbi:MAG: hypothetical protein KKE30_03400 [Gammaproteobacteria bacterium]|nr:hypothetical protein [Gammaproteobacteria bacterium]MBU1554877.1 hypothetical protein [Gammaproteobacteria bacterium]MBU2070990.1 hypothetical protein [Gammaproteobacteria bacterium]MBU2183816.1 hypothetical protein [Gammaproteobacteria bacterium]MBU2206485.1 hypothetical protein [Gammaproteobacteria bacterium]
MLTTRKPLRTVNNINGRGAISALSISGGLLLVSAHLYNGKLLHKLQGLQHAAN